MVPGMKKRLKAWHGTGQGFPQSGATTGTFSSALNNGRRQRHRFIVAERVGAVVIFNLAGRIFSGELEVIMIFDDTLGLEPPGGEHGTLR